MRPSITLTASLTIGTPVTLEMNGIVRLERGLTSMTYTWVSFADPMSDFGLRYAGPPITTYWMFISPRTSSARPIRVV